ncbi:Clp protease N-terminal domain-containing protein [Streptomyces capparidis]
MQSNTRPAEPPGVGLESALTAELRSAVAGARRRAARDADRQVDTAHLLHSLLECDPRVREQFQPAQLARLLGYLVQRSIGFGLQWQASVEDSGGLPVIAAPLAERVPGQGEPPAAESAAAASPGDGGAPGRAPGERAAGAGGRGGPGWSPAAATALRRAVARAHGGGRELVEGVDLLAAVAADEDNRAVDVLRFAGVDVVAMTAALPR